LKPLQRTEFAVMSAALGLDYWLVPEINATQFSHYGTLTSAQAQAAGAVLRAAILQTLRS